MNKHEKINYVEWPAKDIPATKAFFEAVFAWQFEDFGDAYTAFSQQGLDGGFFQSELASSVDNGSALIVFYSDDIEKTLDKVQQAGAEITKPTFSFPGGRRFHFKEPSGNECAVWSEQ